MSFNRLDDLRSSFSGGDSRHRPGRGLFRRGGDVPPSPLSSPLFRRKQINPVDMDDFGGCYSGPPSLASSRESSLDRSAVRSHWGKLASNNSDSSPGSRLYNIVEKVRSSPKLNIKQRLQVMRSGSFNDVSSNKTGSSLQEKRKRWLLGRSESLRVGYEDDSMGRLEMRRGSMPVYTGQDSPVRDRSLDRVGRMERKGMLRHTASLDQHSDEEGKKVKGFVNR